MPAASQTPNLIQAIQGSANISHKQARMPNNGTRG